VLVKVRKHKVFNAGEFGELHKARFEGFHSKSVLKALCRYKVKLFPLILIHMYSSHLPVDPTSKRKRQAVALVQQWEEEFRRIMWKQLFGADI
jgi:hypothetical protein